MRILHVIANVANRYGGPAQAIFGMTESLAGLGHDVTIFTTNQDGSKKLDVPLNKEIVQNNVKIRYFNIQKPEGYGTSSGLFKAIKNEVKNFDIVHIHSLYMFHVAVTSYYCRKNNVPYIIRPHGTLDPYIKNKGKLKKSIYELLIESKNLNNASSIHYTANEEKELAKQFLKNEKSIIVPNGIHSKNYELKTSKESFEKKYPQLKGKKVILFFSRLNFKKGLDILIESFSKVLLTEKNVHLLIVGPDNEGYSKKINIWCEERGITQNVTLTGLKEGNDKIEILKESDVFVLPSYSENFGISVIEAMICKTPVIISNKINIWREVKEENAGIVVNCNSDEVAISIKELLKNDKKVKELSENGFKMVKNHFEWSSVGEKLDKEYNKILSDMNL